jgi:predicted porin
MSALLFSAAVCGGPAFAADLGGDCCADLEERVAELEATTARKGNRKVSLAISGQVNTAVLFFDTEKDSNAYVVDNQNSNSRFRLVGEAKINPNLSAGFYLEIAAGLTAESSQVSEINDDGSTTADGGVAIRHANWYLNHKQAGRLTVGRGSMSTDGITEVDLVGINVVTLAGFAIGNDFTVGGKTFDTVATGTYEFERNNMVRYTTPVMGGFTADAAWGEDDRWDVSLRYAGEMSGFRLAAGIGYGVGTDNSDLTGPAAGADERRIFGGSASVLHVATGLFATGIYSKRTTDFGAGGDFDETMWGARAGISKNWLGIGNTVLYGEYNHWDNELEDNKAQMWGLGIVQNVDAAALELYLAYKNLSVDDVQALTGELAINEDAHLVITGARIRF